MILYLIVFVGVLGGCTVLALLVDEWSAYKDRNKGG
jgi:hypothetical protein